MENQQLINNVMTYLSNFLTTKMMAVKGSFDVSNRVCITG